MKFFKLFENWDNDFLNEKLSNVFLTRSILKAFPSEYEKHSSLDRLFSRGTSIEDLEKRLQQILTNDGIEYSDMTIVDPKQLDPLTKVEISSKYASVTFKSNGKPYRITLADQTDAGPTTEQHETCSIIVFERTLKDGDPLISNYIDELAKVYPGIEGDKGWLTAFQAQANALSSYLKGTNVKSYEFFRDDKFTDELYKHAKKLAGFSKKDAWNPADVWIVKDPNKQLKELLATTSIEQLNDVLRSGLKDKTILPISLKKTKSTASVEELNTESLIGSSDIKIQSMVVDCMFLPNKRKFSNNGATIKLTNDAKFVCRSSDARRVKFVFEGTMRGAAAQLGKVPKPILNKVIPAVKSSQKDWNNWKRDSSDIKSYFDYLITNSLVDTINKDWNSFDKGMQELESINQKLYAEKCVAINYMNNLLKLNDPNKAAVELFYAAQKKGDDFGPFIKIY
ncbi:MAG: hypothetical protein H8D92_00220 [Pelagibacteraceae bacterium]|nr:hypothetical protein [Pelagibacteraceae bacterium]